VIGGPWALLVLELIGGGALAVALIYGAVRGVVGREPGMAASSSLKQRMRALARLHCNEP
jgi:hypothetical protein